MAAMLILFAKPFITAGHILYRFYQQHAHKAVALLADGPQPLPL